MMKMQKVGLQFTALTSSASRQMLMHRKETIIIMLESEFSILLLWQIQIVRNDKAINQTLKIVPI